MDADRPATGDERRRRAPRAVTYPYRRIAHVDGTPSDGPDPYGDPDPAWLKIVTLYIAVGLGEMKLW